MTETATPVVYLITSEGAVARFTEREKAEAAQQDTPESFVVSSEEELANVPAGVLLAVYNTANPETPVRKFVNHEMAVNRTYPLLEKIAPAPAPAKRGGKGSGAPASNTPASNTPAPAPASAAPKGGKFVVMPDNTALRFAKIADARAVAEGTKGAVLVAKADDLVGLSMPALVAINNAAAPDAQVKKFPSKERGAELVFPLLGSYSTEGTVPEKEKRSRAPGFAGKTVIPTKVGLDAKRRPDTRRSVSFAVLAAKPKGMSYEDYIKGGGHADDLATIVRLGHAEVK